MRTQSRKRAAKVLTVCGAVPFMAGVVAFWDNCIPIGNTSAIWLSQAELRIVYDQPLATSPVWRGHPLEVRYKARGGGWMLEVGSYPLFGIASVVWITAAVIHPKPVPAGLCTSCRYDLRGQSPQTRVCPECGGPIGAG